MSELVVWICLIVAVGLGGCGKAPETSQDARGVVLAVPSPLPPRVLYKCVLEAKRRLCLKPRNRYTCYKGLDANSNGVLDLPVEASASAVACLPSGFYP